MRPRRCAASGSAGARSEFHVDRASCLPRRSSASCVAVMTAQTRGDAASVAPSAHAPAAVSTCTTILTCSASPRSRSSASNCPASAVASSGDSTVATTALRPGHTAAARSSAASSRLTRTQARRRACPATPTALCTIHRAASRRDGCTSVVSSRQMTSASPLIASSVESASSMGTSSTERPRAPSARGRGAGSGARSYSPFMAARAAATSASLSRRLTSRSGQRWGFLPFELVAISSERSPNTMPSKMDATPSPAAASCSVVPGPASRLSSAMSVPSTTVVERGRWRSFRVSMKE